MGRRLAIAFAILLLLVGGWVLSVLRDAGEFTTIQPHTNATCRAVMGVPGAEDITIHPRTGIAYLSADDRRPPQMGGTAKGALYSYDLNAESPLPINLTPNAPASFHPHGVSLFVAPGGASTLFVINHDGNQHTIEIFDIIGDRLKHRSTLADPLLRSPNDLHAISQAEVYITNDHRYRSGPMNTLEDFLRLPYANVIRWDGKSFREVASGIRIANGINASADGKTVYVNSVTGQTLRVYDRDARTGDLDLQEEIALESGGDNIEIAADGSLWIGAHPKLLTLVRYMAGKLPYAPSQVLRVVPRGNVTVEEIYLNAGEEISGASVAAVQGKRLLIGPIMDDKFLDCRMP